MKATGMHAAGPGRRRGGLHEIAAVSLAVALCTAVAATAWASDRHAGYYYPTPATTEIYNARSLTLPDASREARLGFVIGMTQKMLGQAYPPQFAIFAKGDQGEKLIIIGLRDGYLNTLYRARAILAMLTSVARSTQFLTELGVAEFFTFLDLAKLMGFSQITISDGDSFAHQIIIK
jgi:hypothetical protein